MASSAAADADSGPLAGAETWDGVVARITPPGQLSRVSLKRVGPQLPLCRFQAHKNNNTVPYT
eukprot:13747328-Heterocapsa_arctica.AAC.1